MGGHEQEGGGVPHDPGHNHRRAVGERHRAGLDQRQTRENRNAKRVGPRFDDAVRIAIDERLESVGPAVVYLEQHDNVSIAVAEIGHPPLPVGIVDEQIERHDPHRFASGGAVARRQPVGQDHRRITDHRHQQGEDGWPPQPAAGQGKPHQRREQPVPAEVARQIKQPVPAAGEPDERYGRQPPERQIEEEARPAMRA